MGAVFETWQRREGSGALSHDSLYFGFVHLITPFNIFWIFILLQIYFILFSFYLYHLIFRPGTASEHARGPRDSRASPARGP